MLPVAISLLLKMVEADAPAGDLKMPVVDNEQASPASCGKHWSWDKSRLTAAELDMAK